MTIPTYGSDFYKKMPGYVKTTKYNHIKPHKSTPPEPATRENEKFVDWYDEQGGDLNISYVRGVKQTPRSVYHFRNLGIHNGEQQ